MRKLLTFALLVLASQAAAQESYDPIETTAAICIGPGLDVDDPYEGIRDIPRKDCEKACKAQVQGCMAVEKTRQKCGVAFLKSVGRIAEPICSGQGGTKAECKFVKRTIKLDVEAWVAAGHAAIVACETEGVECYSVCRD